MTRKMFVILGFVFIVSATIITNILLGYLVQLVVCAILCTIFGIVGYQIDAKQKFKNQ